MQPSRNHFQPALHRLAFYIEHLTRPDDTITERKTRDTARLLAALAFAGLILSSISTVLIITAFGFDRVAQFAIFTTATLVLVYGLSRSTYHNWGRITLCSALAVGVFTAIISIEDPYVGIIAIMPILVLSLLASLLVTTLASLVYITQLLVLINQRPDSAETLIVVTAFVSVMAVIVLVSTVVRRRIEHQLNMRTEALAQSEARFREAIESGLDVFLLFESIRDDQNKIVDFKIIDLNSRALKLYNQRRETVIGERISTIYPDLKTIGLFDQYVQVVETKTPILDEIHIPEEGPNAGWYRYQFTPVGDGVAITTRDITRTKITEQNLIDSEARFRMVAENAPDTIYIMNLEDYSITYLNRQTFLGYSREEIQAENSLTGRIHADDRKMVLEEWQKLTAGEAQTIQQMEYRLLNKDNQWEWIQSRARVIHRQDDNQSKQLLLTLSVITERKNNEEALRHSEERFKAQYKGIPIPTHTWQHEEGEFTLVDYNDAANTFFDNRLVYYLGQTSEEVYPDFPPIHPHLVECFTGKTTFQRALTHTMPRIGERHFNITYAFVPPDLIMTHLEDITEQTATQRALQNSESQYRSLIEVSGDGIYLVYDGMVEMINPSFTRMTGISAVEVAEKNITALDIIADESKAFMEPLFSQKQKVVPPARLEFMLKHKTGETVEVEASTSAIAYQGGIAIQVVCRDISERRRTEAQRMALAMERERVELLQGFIGDVSHDLLTPITVMKTSLYLLARSYSEDQRLDRMRKIEVQINHLEKMIRDMLTLSELDTSLQNLFKPEKYDLNVCVSHIIGEHQSIAFDKEQKIQFVKSDAIPPVYIDVHQFRRALMNLIGNAVKYTPNKGTITIVTGLTPHGATPEAFIEVHDTGVGIPQEALPHIFNRFYRGDEHRPSDGGAGLGLAIADKIIEAHHGRIEVESMHGKGSIFRVVIPVTQEKADIDPDETMTSPIIKVQHQENLQAGRPRKTYDDDETLPSKIEDETLPSKIECGDEDYK